MSQLFSPLKRLVKSVRISREICSDLLKWSTMQFSFCLSSPPPLFLSFRKVVLHLSSTKKYLYIIRGKRHLLQRVFLLTMLLIYMVSLYFDWGSKPYHSWKPSDTGHLLHYNNIYTYIQKYVYIKMHIHAYILSYMHTGMRARTWTFCKVFLQIINRFIMSLSASMLWNGDKRFLT